MKTVIKLRDDNGRIIATARSEADKTLPEIIGDILIAAGLVWIAVEAAELFRWLVLLQYKP
ncbi:hypothetical protein [Paenibacillus pseudetheri]|uniref:Uncharacterized protein n=1 Tax=Paenibacillus pseudetheri TaxID=2897682 RepID=A0ABM9BJ96_9BACL|nr:hypothetical protein [Paenibacillus pseudetheri]CAH1058796.1 hypothetical protein PAECIP111894_04982 [Paenibacillus pseudetheri]